eukprot:3076967-Amphidinium_carterae.1
MSRLRRIIPAFAGHVSNQEADTPPHEHKCSESCHTDGLKLDEAWHEALAARMSLECADRNPFIQASGLSENQHLTHEVPHGKSKHQKPEHFQRGKQ